MYLRKHKVGHATLRGGRSDSEPDPSYMQGWDDSDESVEDSRERAKQQRRDQQEQLHDLAMAEEMRPEREEEREELSFAHVTDTVQRSERRKKNEWTV